MNNNNKENRYWELDFLRGVAIILMVAYHVYFVLNCFEGTNCDLYSSYTRFLALGAQILFFSLVGISLYISYNRNNSNKTFKKYLVRGLKIFLYGLLITLSSLYFGPGAVILFGVLQFIGISVIVGYFFLNLGKINLVIGLILIALNILIKNISTNNYFLLIFGIRPENYSSLDYFPLIPWFGVILIGIFLGGVFYSNNTRKIKIYDFSVFFPINLLSYFGKHSLFIYMIHFPVIFLFVYLFSK